MRIGHGYDAHRFQEKRKLILGGVEIDYPKGLQGHSDADVVTHAVMDSILGGLGMGDIGTLFSDKDQQFKDIYSIKLLQVVIEKMKEKGYEIGNLDVTIIAQEPKIAPYIEKMKSRLAQECEIDKTNINIKGTTEEKMGFTGRLEGISTHAVVLLKKKYQNG